ncbi:ParB/RepB/Spo0J family partition protein [Marinihelvus fidelis]|uniref:Probable chromosome-partitioning protein ParB n=1 Tax=Marinihelvus fidelis TaxID=2613842 RepID=A0A5N0T9N7_9GAMM|nr:ParB/RepB/Spo0J family partition protein [Marinihelvus fidelis]KAA9131650.1 ParB/RepB/Spo0J family partition protein [Marinihelvus fidelis]
MAAKKAPLGRNLSSMLSKSTLAKADADRAADNGSTAAPGDASLRELPLDRITPGPYQPRSIFDEDKLDELADSIEKQGVIQPIVVREVGAGFELIAGERRWRAAQRAGIDTIPAIVRRVPDEIAVAMALVENIQRENLNPLEEATALRRLVDEFQLTHAEAAEAVGRSRSAVSNLLRLLELSADVRGLVDDRHLEMGHARALLALPPELQVTAAREVVRKQLSVRETEQLVKRLQRPNKPKPRAINPDILRLQDDLTERLCAKVRIQHGAKGKGKLVIDYNSADELEGIIGHLAGDGG